MRTRLLCIARILATVSLLSCSDPLAMIPLGKRELVTVCFISPQDTVLRANVNWANPFDPDFNDSFVRADTVNQIKNAIVILQGENSSIHLEFNDDIESRSRYGYTASAKLFSIEPGKTYTLEVTLPSGEHAVASCTIPELAAEQLSLEYSRTGETISGPLYSYKIRWKDLPGTGNYYRTYAYLAQHYALGTLTTPLGETGLTVRLDKNLFNDYLGNAGFFQSIDNFENPLPSSYPTMLHAQVLHVDRHYYEYHRSIEDQSKVGNNPFYEPVLLYTNFRGGIGVFSGFNMAEVEIPFEN